MQATASAMLLAMFSILFPAKMWFAPDQPVMVQVRGINQPARLVLMDPTGKPVEGDIDVNVNPDQSIDLKQYWPQLRTGGTYMLGAVPPGQPSSRFLGTPLIVDVRLDRRRDAPPGPMVVRVEPMCYAVLSTEKGVATIIFYYDAAPDTVANFIRLALEGFYDGLTFHEIKEGFKIQGGDPRGDGTGGPGYRLEAEFSSRAHREGVLSMARQLDPVEQQGLMPRSEFANSAGSQFFIALNYERTRQLDGRYTTFGQVVQGMEVIREIAKAATDPQNNRPITPQIIKSITIRPVTADSNPYAGMLPVTPATRPAAP